MIDETQVLGSWTHSHEEDRGATQTFRPADYPLPPSRGRTTFTLLPDHNAVVGTPGPDDRGARQSGSWSVEHQPGRDVLTISLPDWNETFSIVTAEARQLVLTPITPGG
ncbi:hypothetical protein ACNQVK_27325 [Mycobacterium sp. 134]|uniref:hypothetical protein n=1 Tax=Mycobacterium sp. 134 TaxID=3400425 RepID=UPI003AAF0581